MIDIDIPEHIRASLQDTLDSGALDIINASDGQHVHKLLEDLSAQMTTKKEANAASQAECLQLLMWCYSMRLDAGNKTEPFQPAFRMADGSTSAKPYHLLPEQVELLAGLYSHIQVAARRARLADLVGLMIPKSRIGHINAAIDAYMATPLDRTSWHESGQQHWHRALRLAISFSAGVGDRLEKIESLLLSAFEKACEDANNAAPLMYLRPLRVEELTSHAGAIAPRLQRLADDSKSEGNLDVATHVYQEAAYWYGRGKAANSVASMLNERAVVTESKADGLDTGILRQAFYTDALRYYREIDGKFHKSLLVREAIDRVQCKLEAAGITAISEMHTVRIPHPDIDFEMMAEDAVKRVRGKSALKTMVEFVELDPWPAHTRYLEQAKEHAKVGIFESLVGSTFLAPDGRQVEKVGPLTGDEEFDAPAIESKAIRSFVMYAELTASTAISPAMSQIYMEHALTLNDFQVITSECPIVPLAHSNAIAQGLYAGYQRDLMTALHILLPQFENIVRTVLKNSGVTTTRTDIRGITMEVGLSTLIDEPQMETTFGPSLTFGIRALMCSQVGPNFRNDIAHGLSTSETCHTLVGLYTWWFILKLIFKQWYLASYVAGEDCVEAEESAKVRSD